MDLFNFSEEYKNNLPLAERLRPETLDEFIGQSHIVGANTLLRRAISIDRLGSCIFYGPPGTGKTTLANIIASLTNAHFEKLNAVTSGVADAKKLIEDARSRKKLHGTRTYLLLDECHRWNKAQSDCVLGAIEAGDIIFIGSTTENPFVSMTKAILSRCRVFEFKKLSESDIIAGLKYAVKSPKGLKNLNVIAEESVLQHIAWASDGDLRTALNALELAALTTPLTASGEIIISKQIAEQSIQKPSLSIDESLYYDILSAFCKSLRGSDSDAALYWSERLIQAGCDPMVIARRLIVHSAEDIGLADPGALLIATASLTALQNIGLPEGRIPLAEAIIYVAEASKSNSVVTALDGANKAATKTKDDNVPYPLRSAAYKIDEVKGYKYPHDYGGWVEQQYLPDSLKHLKFYIPSDNGAEKNLVRAKIIRKNKG